MRQGKGAKDAGGFSGARCDGREEGERRDRAGRIPEAVRLRCNGQSGAGFIVGLMLCEATSPLFGTAQHIIDQWPIDVGATGADRVEMPGFMLCGLTLATTSVDGNTIQIAIRPAGLSIMRHAASYWRNPVPRWGAVAPCRLYDTA